VEINPKIVTVVTDGAWSFFAYAHWSSGTTNDSSLTSGFTFTATGGTLSPSTANAMLYTAGSATGTYRVIARHYTGKADTAVVTITPGTPPPPPSPTLSSVVVSPPSVSILTGAQQQFTADGQYSDGSTKALVAAWNASGGTINTGGLYAAGALAGAFRVIGSDPASGKADTSVVTIIAPQPPPPPSPYTPIVARDWKTFADKAALAGTVGVEGSNHNCRGATEPSNCSPHLPPTDFYDLVSDPIFGKALRYLGGPQLNTIKKDFPGRVATYQVSLGSCSGLTAGATWWLAPNGCRYPTKLWVHQFMRFSSNWTTASNTGGQGSADYKTLFLRYFNSSDRLEFIAHSLQQWLFKGGGGGAGATTSEGTLPLHNVKTINVEFTTSGYGEPHIGAPFHTSTPYKTISPTGNCQPPGAPCGMGDEEWWEIIIYHNTVGNRGEHTMWLRPYTTGKGTVIAPGAWRIQSRFRVGQPGAQWLGVSHYQMGINRNRQWDEVMHLDWGPFEVVDGGSFTNPWKVPCSATGC
jgi:hypothetical protein